MFVNFSNHPSSHWSVEQLVAAGAYGSIKDIPFPAVPANASTYDVQLMAKETVEKILADGKPEAVLCQGEASLAFYVTRGLLQRGVSVFVACSDRQVEEIVDPATGETVKTAVFKFVRFRVLTLI